MLLLNKYNEHYFYVFNKEHHIIMGAAHGRRRNLVAQGRNLIDDQVCENKESRDDCRQMNVEGFRDRCKWTEMPGVSGTGRCASLTNNPGIHCKDLGLANNEDTCEIKRRDGHTWSTGCKFDPDAATSKCVRITQSELNDLEAEKETSKEKLFHPRTENEIDIGLAYQLLLKIFRENGGSPPTYDDAVEYLKKIRINEQEQKSSAKLVQQAMAFRSAAKASRTPSQTAYYWSEAINNFEGAYGIVLGDERRAYNRFINRFGLTQKA